MTKLEQARRARKFSQMELAARAKVAQSDVSAMENGWRRPYPKQAKRLARVLGLTPDELTEPADDHKAA